MGNIGKEENIMNKNSIIYENEKNQTGVTLITIAVAVGIILILVGVIIYILIKDESATTIAKNNITDKDKEAYDLLQNTIRTSAEASEILKNQDRSIIELNQDEGDSTGDGKITIEDDLRGFYVDLDGDGKLSDENDGIIFGDLLTGGSGIYFCRTCEDYYNLSKKFTEDDKKFIIGSYKKNWSYTIPKKENVNLYERIKDWKGKVKTFNGQFGTRGMIQLKNKISDGNRFYVMSLKDLDNKTFKLDNQNITKDLKELTSTEFGKGESNTSEIIKAYTKNDENNINTKEEAGIPLEKIQEKMNDGWFIPSRDEWNAFGAFFKIGSNEKSNIGRINPEYYYYTDFFDYNEKYKLNSYYLSSSLNADTEIWRVDFEQCYSYCTDNNDASYIRLCKTF